ncbi:MAG: FixH family protein [Massilia sp.]
MRFFHFSLLALVVSLNSGCSMMSTPDNLDLRLARPSAHGTYQVTLQAPAEAVVVNRIQSWQLHIAAPDGSAVSNAHVIFDGGMPQHGHGFPTSPRISAVQGGDYRIDGVKFSMGGWWEIKLAIDGARGSDTVTFNTMLGEQGLLAPKAVVP